jgi:hypothetical protein
MITRSLQASVPTRWVIVATINASFCLRAELRAGARKAESHFAG